MEIGVEGNTLVNVAKETERLGKTNLFDIEWLKEN